MGAMLHRGSFCGLEKEKPGVHGPTGLKVGGRDFVLQGCVGNVWRHFWLSCRGFPGGLDSKESAHNAGDPGSIPG